MAKELMRDENAPTPEELALISLLETRSREGGNEDERLQSYAMLAYYAGKQWITLNRASKQLMPTPREPWEVQYTANRIMPIVRTELAKVMRNRLTCSVVPGSSDDEDIRAARLGEKVVEWLEYDLELQEQDQEAILWALTTRIGFMWPFWNTQKGLVLSTEDGKPDVRQGDVDVDVLSLFEVKWDMTASRWEDVRWVMVERMRTTDYVKRVYGVEVDAEEGLTATNLYDGKLRSLTSGNAFGAEGASNVTDSVIVRYCIELPSAEYPQGRTIVTAHGKLLYQDEDIGFGPEDDSERECPIFPLIHVPIPGRIIGSCIAEQCMPVQREYNKSRSQIIENKNLMANPIWLVESGSLDDGETISNRPGSMVHYQKGFNPPVMSQPTALGPDVDKNIERCLEELMFISGQQEVSHGDTPTGVTSGVAIQLLQDQDDTKLGPTIQQYSRFKQRYLSYLLKMIRYKYDVERTVKITGEGSRTEAITFKGGDLLSCDVRMDPVSTTQRSKAVRQQHIMELAQMGILTDMDMILRALELDFMDNLYDGINVDVQQATNENAQWQEGDMSPIVRDFYNHEVHIANHNRFRKSNEYERMDLRAKALVDSHVQQHLTYMAMAMAPAGAPGMAPGGEMAPEDVNGAVASLSPEEQQILQQNPQLLQQASQGVV